MIGAQSKTTAMRIRGALKHVQSSARQAMRPFCSRIFILAAAVVALVLTGCASIPEGRSAVDSVHVVNATALDGRDVQDKLATAESPKFLGLFRGLFYDYE